MSNFVVLSAAKFEALPLIKILEKNAVNFEYCEIGIGSINAAKKSLDLRLKNKKVIFIGTCGVFAKDFQPHLLTASRCIWSPPSVRNNTSQLIDNIDPDYDLSATTYLTKNLPKAIIACSPSITIDETLVPPIDENVAENLELYSIAEKLLEAKEVSIILGVTNRVCSEGRSQWLKNHKIIADMTANYLDQLIDYFNN